MDFSQDPDAALSHVARLASLEELHCVAAPVTDAGLVHLAGLASLEELYLENTHITDAGADELRRSLPNCKVIGP